MPPPSISVPVVVLLLLAGLVPPDTSLTDRQKAGVLKLCVPQSFPPARDRRPFCAGL